MSPAPNIDDRQQAVVLVRDSIEDSEVESENRPQDLAATLVDALAEMEEEKAAALQEAEQQHASDKETALETLRLQMEAINAAALADVRAEVENQLKASELSFDAFDRNSDGVIDREEFEVALASQRLKMTETSPMDEQAVGAKTEACVEPANELDSLPGGARLWFTR